MFAAASAMFGATAPEATEAPERHPRADAFGILVAGRGEGRHLRLEGTGGKGIHGDAPFGELDGERPGEMVHSGFRGGVGIGAVGDRLGAHDRPEIDDAGRVLVAGRCIQ